VLFYVHKEASLDNQLYDKHTVFPQYKIRTILNNKTFNPTSFLMPSIFYIPIRFSPTPQSQIMPFHSSAGFQYSHCTHHNNISAQQWAPFTHNLQHTTPNHWTV